MANACIANQKQLESAVEQWALEHQKVKGDSVSLDDLVGPNKYIRVKPVCPSGGVYPKVLPVGTLDILTQPICSLDHLAHQRRKEFNRKIVFWAAIAGMAGALAGLFWFIRRDRYDSGQA